MSRLTDVFARAKAGGRPGLVTYVTAGDPTLERTAGILRALDRAGVTVIEVGVPFSDPLADGPVIQASSSKALANGMTIAKLFDQLRGFRHQVYVPVILMGYMNPALQYGFEKFCASAAAAGIDGLILPDLPMYEFETEFGEIIAKHGLKFIFLVTPETSEERVRMLDRLSTGFLYAVSSSSTTGNEKSLEQQMGYFKKLQDMQLNNPVLIGFGIKDSETFNAACRYANGAIIGTAYIKAIGQNGSVNAVTKKFIDGIVG